MESKKQIPEFNDDGHLPYGCHPATLKEYKERFVSEFVNSGTRKIIYSDFVEYSEFLSGYNLEILKWMGGSFTSNKENPHDIDMVVLYDGFKFEGHPDAKEFEIFFLENQGCQKVFHHTIYIPVYPITDIRHELTQKEKKRWSDFFSKTKEKKPRGLVRLDTLSEEYCKTLNEEM